MFFFTEKDENIKITPKSIEHAYLSILNDDLISAEEVFKLNDSPRSRWGIILIEILTGFLQTYPTYFEIRNFLEIDMDFLLKNEKLDYIEQILGASEILITINQETYKYIARVMYENKLYKVARDYLEKSKAIFYKDPELHFMLAKYYLRLNDYDNTLYYINECLKILPEYYPAKKIKEQVQVYLAK